MEQFEKWWDKLCCIGDAEALEKYKSRYQTGFCNGYRIALEEVLGWLDYSTEHKEIKDRIHDELESD